MEARELPLELAEPLHLLPALPLAELTWLAALLALAALLLLYRRWLRRRQQPESDRPIRLKPVPDRRSIQLRVLTIGKEAFESGEYRRACHRLAATLRDHLEATATPAPYSALTAVEIGERLGGRMLTRVFTLLAELQFQPQEPSRTDYRAIHDLTLEALGPPGTRRS